MTFRKMLKLKTSLFKHLSPLIFFFPFLSFSFSLFFSDEKVGEAKGRNSQLIKGQCVAYDGII